MPKARTDETGARKRPGQDELRLRLSQVVRIVLGVLAAILAIGAVLVVLRDNVNEQNAIVRFVLDVADAVAGPFSRDNGIFDFGGKNAGAKNALVNWGIAAVVYLVLGRVLAGLVAPRGGKKS